VSEEEARGRAFDALATEMASGTLSRGRMLRLMGAALVGGTLASLPGLAWAAKGGRSSCAKFCQSLFGENTPEEEQCVSAAKSGEGPCFTCTTETGCGPNFTPTCTVTGQTYNCSRCQCECPSGQVACNGSCVSNSCPTGQTFNPSSCTCCTSNGGSCTSGTQCCSGNCDSGACLPPVGPNLVVCVCQDTQVFSRCTSVTCAQPGQVCGPLCAQHGGINSGSCTPNGCAV
jgi:hypothetical protein